MSPTSCQTAPPRDRIVSITVSRPLGQTSVEAELRQPDAYRLHASPRPPRRISAIELPQLVRHRRADEYLRHRWRLEVALLLAGRNALFRCFECAENRVRLREPMLEQRFAEERAFAGVAAAERRAV